MGEPSGTVSNVYRAIEPVVRGLIALGLAIVGVIGNLAALQRLVRIHREIAAVR